MGNRTLALAFSVGLGLGIFSCKESDVEKKYHEVKTDKAKGLTLENLQVVNSVIEYTKNGNIDVSVFVTYRGENAHYKCNGRIESYEIDGELHEVELKYCFKSDDLGNPFLSLITYTPRKPLLDINYGIGGVGPQSELVRSFTEGFPHGLIDGVLDIYEEGEMRVANTKKRPVIEGQEFYTKLLHKIAERHYKEKNLEEKTQTVRNANGIIGEF